MSTRKRTRDVGVYAEPPALSIRLPFTLANFRALLAEGTRPDARYTHQQIKAWADKFWWRYTVWPADPERSVPPEMQAAADLAKAIEIQWVLYIANTYALPELQHVDLAQVRLPAQCFAEWLDQLNQIAPPTVSE